MSPRLLCLPFVQVVNLTCSVNLCDGDPHVTKVPGRSIIFFQVGLSG